MDLIVTDSFEENKTERSVGGIIAYRLLCTGGKEKKWGQNHKLMIEYLYMQERANRNERDQQQGCQ